MLKYFIKENSASASTSAASPPPADSDDVPMRCFSPISDVSVEMESTPALSSVSPSVQFSITSEWRDIGLWPVTIKDNERISIAEKGPIRDHELVLYPLDANNRSFSVSHYSRQLANGEIVDRNWLVYSKQKNSVYCFCCKLFPDSGPKNKLSGNGHDDWVHISRDISSHESSKKHLQAYSTWMEFLKRMKQECTIDKQAQKLIIAETEHWRNILTRIISIIQFLAERNLALRGSVDKLYTSKNGNFLGLVELLAKFDPSMQEHVRRIQGQNIHDHYLGKNIQNEIIKLISDATLKKIIFEAQKAKYFSIILDCTPDVSHQEQMTMIIRFVNINSSPVDICEHFVGFIAVDDTTGEGLTESCLKKLKDLNLEVCNLRGQGYDNGSNMKGVKSGTQKRILDLNPRAFYVPCGCHSLNLVLGDMAKSSAVAMTLFGILQQIFVLFSASTQRWQVFKSHVSGLTVKPLSATRWECKVDSVVALRYQLPEIYDALVDVSERANDAKARTEASALAKEIKCYPFLVSLAIWHDILHQVNLASKVLQTKKVQYDVALKTIESVRKYLIKYKTNGLAHAEITAKELASELEMPDLSKTFPAVTSLRRRKAKMFFDYEVEDEYISSPREKFRIEYFNALLDQAINSMEERFFQMKNHLDAFHFLHDYQKVSEMSEDVLQKSCSDLSKKLIDHNGESDIDSNALFCELKMFMDLVPKDASALEALQFLHQNGLDTAMPNLSISLRIALTVPITVASGERSFSKLKLIKTFLRSTMGQDRLTGLAIISIEQEIVDSLDYSELIKDFSNTKARRINFV